MEGRQNSDSQDSDEPAPPGTSTSERLQFPKMSNYSPKALSKGVENAKKRLRAFSIQKKTALPPVTVAKPVSLGNTTVLIGKLSSNKMTPKPPPVEDEMKPPKPPKPGTSKKNMQEYSDLQKKTLSEIETMKRKMELVELGIPLGLIAPHASATAKAMPTKAMPPIKTFLDNDKIDEIIREAKKAKAEGKEFKFDYQKFVPDYDNPFQRKKEEPVEPDHKEDKKEDKKESERDKGREKRRSDRDRRTNTGKDDRDKHKGDKRSRERDKFRDHHETSRDRTEKKDRDDKRKDTDKEKEKEKLSDEQSKDKKGDPKRQKDQPKDPKETDVNLNDFVVCDSWSLSTDNDDKMNSPQVADKRKTAALLQTLSKRSDGSSKDSSDKQSVDSPRVKIEKLQPVIDSFKFEIDPNDDDDEVLDIFDADLDIEEFAKKKPNLFDSPVEMKTEYGDQDDMNDDTFLESVINEIKQENASDDEGHGLVEYDSPYKDSTGSVTPELDDKIRGSQSERSDCSGYKSTDSKKSSDSRKSSESGYKSSASHKSDKRRPEMRSSIEKEMDNDLREQMGKSTVDSLETWSFVLKICQPLLFRHDRNKCYRETSTHPKVWFTENPKLCSCVKDRSVVYEELEMCKTGLVNSVYGSEQPAEEAFPPCRGWYPRLNASLSECARVPRSSEWEIEAPTPNPAPAPKKSTTPDKDDEVLLDLEYQKFMEAVWPEATDKDPAGSTTPVTQDTRKTKKKAEDERKAKKMKMSSDCWSQESEAEEPMVEKSKKKMEKEKIKEKRKRKHSTSSNSESESVDEVKKKKKKKSPKKKAKKLKVKEAKRRRAEKKMLKKLKNKKKKKQKAEKESTLDDEPSKAETKKKNKKLKKKQQLKAKKKAEKKKARSSSSSESSSSSSESEDQRARRKREKAKKKEKKKRRRQSTSESTQSEELFDVNILNNIKTERLTDDERRRGQFSPVQRHREIIDVKELQQDFTNIQIKQEKDEVLPSTDPQQDSQNSSSQSESVHSDTSKPAETDSDEIKPNAKANEVDLMNRFELNDSQDSSYREKCRQREFKEPPRPDELSQCSSQESTSKEAYEKDESHLRPSSQNSNYSFRDVIEHEAGDKFDGGKFDGGKFDEGKFDGGKFEEKFDADKFEGYENYEMYEQMAMEYQSDVASQISQTESSSTSGADVARAIETVVRSRQRGEIKCDWRKEGQSVSDNPAPMAQRPSRWGLKPGEVNIVLTGFEATPPAPRAARDSAPAPAQGFPIPSLANRSDNSNIGYDEAYMDMYGASDRLQYGDCFGSPAPPARDPRLRNPPSVTSANISPVPRQRTTTTLDDRISRVLNETALGEVAKEAAPAGDKEAPEKGILVTAPLGAGRGKRVSFADGYTPGQDSDVEEPPLKKRKKRRRVGCPWPCPLAHPDHVPLWDALPPPPPPPGSPPPPPQPTPAAPLAAQLLRMQQHHQQQFVPHGMLPPPHKFDNQSLPAFMPPEPPPGMITFP